jgi:isochorismate synthase
LADILKYRIPGESIVEKTGHFTIDYDTKEPKGFVIGDFISDAIYIFQETTVKGELSFLTEKPYIASHEEYIEESVKVLEAFDSFGLQKMVLSRIKQVDFDETKSELLFRELVKKYPNAFVYLISSKLFGTWIGATPEILLVTALHSGFTMALAGTKKADDTSDWESKENDEQQFVTDFIQTRLIENKYENVELSGPFEVIAGPVKHLRTDISFDFENGKALKTIRTLHPTPAVSGFPQKEAISQILETEKHERLFYTGFIGLMNQNKNQIYVNLRCCQIQKGAAYLYLGGGFTKDSIPELEWQETENKSKTLLNILQKL